MKLLFFIVFLLSTHAQAEPWLANKFSKNCAACHSPGRINREPKKRKCTLSCQGCHVNPNGGGIRNAYGKWNSKRWLKSFNSKKWTHGENTPAPVQMQTYADEYPQSVKPKQVNKKAVKLFRKKGRSPLITLNNYVKNEAFYNKHNDLAWKYTAKSDDEFITFMTRHDPYFIEKRGTTQTNAEIRYLFLTNSGDQSPGNSLVGFAENSGQGFMAFDLGLRYKPLLDKNFSLVFEHRYLNSPYNQEYNAIFVRGLTRSAYAIYDGLSYNTYVMGGIFRPMFGQQSANHRALREVLAFGQFGGAGSSQVRYEGVSIGSSPNVPFFNLTYLKDSGLNALNGGTDGFVANVGLRFVTLGASMTASYWSSTSPDQSGELTKDMFALAIGANYKRLTGNFEFLGFDEEFSPGASNSGGVMTGELKYRIFKESYLTFSYASANTSRNQRQGDSSDLSIGYRMFALSGLELDLSYWMHTNNDESELEPITDWNSVQAQIHLYF